MENAQGPGGHPELQEVVASSQRDGFAKLVSGDFAAWARIWMPDKAANSVSAQDRFRLLWNQCGMRATFLYRISFALKRAHVPVLPGIVSRLNLCLYGFDVPASVEIGAGLYVPHPVGTVVMASRIGCNVSLISSITIGMRNEHIFPTIGNNVFIGAGARVLGAITIGDGASIGANAVVVSDVPSGRTAVGVPAKLLPLKKEQAPAEA